jgi:hypothetical protein
MLTLQYIGPYPYADFNGMISNIIHDDQSIVFALVNLKSRRVKSMKKKINK